MKYFTAFSTFPDADTARKVSRILVEKGLVACVNLIPAIESIYEWEGKVCQEHEVLIMMKTTEEKLTQLEHRLVALHPYDVPEWFAIEIVAGHEPYLEWVKKITTKE